MWPLIWSNLNPLHPVTFCVKFGWNQPIGSGEGDENVKSIRQHPSRKRQTYGQILIRKAHLSLRFGWAKNVDFEMGNKVFEVGIFSHMYKFIYTTMVFWNYKFHYFSLTLHHLQVYYIWFEKDEINYCRTGCIKQNS